MPELTKEELESLRCCENCKYKIIRKDGKINQCQKWEKSYNTNKLFNPNEVRCKDHEWQFINLN